jgi:ADP-ribose pyrophosphatase YjhB (NUDIX family)
MRAVRNRHPVDCYTARVSQRPKVAFCCTCGTPTVRRVPAGDTRARDCCEACGAIHYANPRPVVGTIPAWGGKVLLCRRAIEPRRGFWTLPAGFMEVGESSAEGAQRETLEEANARVLMGPLFSMIDIPTVEQIHLFYRARLLDLAFSPGEESLEVQLFTEAQIPWGELAFRTVEATLRLYFQDLAAAGDGTYTRSLPARRAPIGE